MEMEVPQEEMAINSFLGQIDSSVFVSCPSMVVTAVEESSTHGLEYGSVLESRSSQEEASNMFIEWHKIFIPGTMKIDKRYTNCWSENVPNLSEECSQTKVADLLGKKVKIGNEEFSTELLSLADASRLLVPRKFGEAFPVQNSGTGVSRILLRQDLIRLWNGWMDRFDPSKEFRCSDFNIVSAASGLERAFIFI
ncbi:hypothetical protein GAYE_SCF26G4623 [Galdieria yellowstonensis]|uniref:Uncharacterized protein n=1 Tax=Galdieria yellowstonensis TaxID=3028027 RepID=A0AAV9IGW4_9RHOD|nr:hypothetical protein GAYE_SCF26G4623 [Galdieria yellowstonensis]